MEGYSDGIEPVNEDLINQRIEMLRDNFLELQDENHVLLSKVNDIYFRFDEYEFKISDLKNGI